MPDGTPEIAIVGVVSKLLSDLVARNDQLPLAPTQVTPFHSSKPPSISVRSYLEDRCAAPHLPAPMSRQLTARTRLAASSSMPGARKRHSSWR